MPKKSTKRFFLQDILDEVICKPAARRFILKNLVTLDEASVMAKSGFSKTVLEELLTNEANLIALKQRFTDDSDLVLEITTVLT